MKKIFFVLAFVIATSVLAFGQTHYYGADGVAIKGYDPVAYFKDGDAKEGKKDYSYSWQGLEWRFKDQSNLDAFKKDPEKYAPQFGGYCAYGASENHKAPTDPTAFTIVNDKLYLNYNGKVKELWKQDVPGNIKKAEKNWSTLKDQK